MSNMPPANDVSQAWNQPQPVGQIEEEYPYLLSTQGLGQTFQQRPARVPQFFNESFASSQYSSLASNQFGPPHDGNISASHRQVHSPSLRDTGLVGGDRQLSLEQLGGINTSQNGFTIPGQESPSPNSLDQQGFANNSQAQFTYRTSYQPGRQASTSPGGATIPIGGSHLGGDMMGASYISSPMQFPYPVPPPTRRSEVQGELLLQGMRSSASMHCMQKRARDYDANEDSFDFSHDNEAPSDTNRENPIRPKPTGACARCKSLKVRCEFPLDQDVCKRCNNTNHECVIPGRKKRRAPPKREHLLNQIRDQAAQIQRLMAQLEALNHRPDNFSTASSTGASESRSHTPTSSIDLQSTDLESDTISQKYVMPRAEVQDWIAKARESFEAFGSFIGMGGAAMTKGMLVEEDLEDSGSTEDDEEFVFSVETDDDRDGTTDGGDNQTNQGNGPRHPSFAQERPTMHSPSSSKKKDLGILPNEASPFGLIAKLSLKQGRGKSAEPEVIDDALGVASQNFFRPSTPDPEQTKLGTVSQHLPPILKKGIITPAEAEALFKIYFDNMNMSTSLLDHILYTPQYTVFRSPFLFTVICAVASRYYAERPDLYSELMRYAHLAAGQALISGIKNEELCHAFILLTLYPVPTRRWEEERGWIYLGLAIRIAQDLNLHRPNTAKPLNEHHARVLLNRTRIWLNCFNLDRSTGSQYGKSFIISNADYVASHSADWWRSSEYNLEHFDIQLCCYNAELKVMANFMSKIYSNPQHPTGLNKDVDFEKLVAETDDELQFLLKHWMGMLEKTDQTNVQNRFRTGLLKLAFSYARLVVLSVWFQFGFGKGSDDGAFLNRCLRAATAVVHIVVDDIARPEQKIYWRHGPEAQSVFVTFACVFLVRLLQPKYMQYLSHEQRLEIRALIEKTIELLGSPEIAVDDRHGPKLYSRFLRGLLDMPMAQIDYVTPQNQRASPNRRVHPKSPLDTASTPGSLRPELSDSTSYHGSPLIIQSSPALSNAQIPYDVFSSGGGHDQSYSDVQNYPQDQATGMLYTAPYLTPPMPFGDDLLESMQTMTDPVWQDGAVTGFNWMMQSNTGLGDYTMDDQFHYMNGTFS